MEDFDSPKFRKNRSGVTKSADRLAKLLNLGLEGLISSELFSPDECIMNEGDNKERY